VTDVAVIGAGSSGLAVLKALREHGIEARCFERGSHVGGLWRYGNDSGMSSAYASLRTNVSRERMAYPSLPMPASYGDFPHHTDMAAYMDAYAEAFGLRDRIDLNTTIERVEPDPPGWRVTRDDGETTRHRGVVVAVGHDWAPRLPDDPGSFDGHAIHSHDYRTPEPYEGRRVLVVGAGPSAAEIAVEVATVARATTMSIRRGAHVIPRHVKGRAYDSGDVSPWNRLPWRLLNAGFAALLDDDRGPVPPAWPQPPWRLLENVPIPSSDLLPAVRDGAIAIRPAIERLNGASVRFADGSEEPFDAIVYATGYEMRFPFMAPGVLEPRGRELPLLRRIVPPNAENLFLAGFVDAPGGLLPIVELQGEWIAAVLTGGLRLPQGARPGRQERRTRRRFPSDGPDSIRCDPHAYRRLLRRDLRRARLPRTV
jgi:flavin-binding monooxygenase-like protein